MKGIKNIFENKYLKRNFLIAIGGILIIILLIRLFVLSRFETVEPPNLPVVSQIKDPAWLIFTTRLLDSLFVSLTVTISIALYLSYVEITDDQKKFEIVEPFKIKGILEQERRKTNIWYYSGGTGRFTRSTTFPELSRIAKSANMHITMKIQIIDPTNDAVCKSYSYYRASLKSAGKNGVKWTKEYVKQETIATIVSAVLYKLDNPLLDIDICLKNNFSTLRIDLSSETGVITKEDPQEPALICRAGSFLYRTYVEEIFQTFKQYKSINTSLQYEFSIAEINVQNLKDILRDLRLDDNITDADVVAIFKILNENKNPYA